MENIQLTKENIDFTKELFRKEDIKPNFFFIQDDLGILTKRQKRKMKEWCQENKFNEESLLKEIHYPEGEKKRYNKIERRWDEKQNYYLLRFTNEPTEKDLQKQKLREKIKSFRNQRTPYIPPPSLSGKSKRMWEFYEKIKALPQVRAIPLNMLDTALPNPDTILADRSTYEKYLAQIPDSCIKDYFKLCLS